MRSVVTMNNEKLITRLNTLIAYLKTDSHFMNYIGNKFSKIEAECYRYIALHLALAKENAKAIHWFFKAIKKHFPIIWQQNGMRTAAIIKHLLKNNFSGSRN